MAARNGFCSLCGNLPVEHRRVLLEWTRTGFWRWVPVLTRIPPDVPGEVTLTMGRVKRTRRFCSAEHQQMWSRAYAQWEERQAEEDYMNSKKYLDVIMGRR